MTDQEKIFKKVASEHERHIDFESLWEHLEPHVPIKQKRRPIIFWFWLAGTVIFGLSMFTLTMNDITHSAKMKAVQTPAYTPIKDDIKKDIVSLDNYSERIHIQPYKQRKAAEIRKAEKVSTFNQSVLPLSDSLISEIKSDLNVVNWITNSDKTKVNISFADQFEDDQEKSVTQSNSNVISIEEIAYPKRQEMPSLSPLVTFIGSINTNSTFEIPKIEVLKRKKLNILVYGGAGIALLDSKIFDKEQNGISQKYNYETPLEYINLKVSSDIKLSHRWYIQPGIRYSRYSSRINHEASNYMPITKSGITEIIIDDLGAASSIKGDVSGTKKIDIKSKWHSYHHSFELPINLRYLLSSSFRHKFYIDAGPTLQCWTKSEGGYVDQNGQLQKYTMSDSPFGADLLGLSGGISWEYHILPQGALYTGLVYDRRSIQRTEDGAKIRQTFSSFSLNIGYKKHF